MNVITKLKVQQWVQTSLQLTQLFRWDSLRSNFVVSVLLSMESFYLNILRKTGTVFRMTAI